MNVKNKKRGRPEKSSNSLSVVVILNQAKVMLQRDGKVPSIRQLATELGVDAMAIYHYFTNKQALLEALVVSLVEELPEVDHNATWQQQLLQLSQGYVQMLVRHPGLLEIMLGMTNPEGPAKVFTERYQQIVAHLSLSEAHFKHSLDLLADYLHGFALAYVCHPAMNKSSSQKTRAGKTESGKTGSGKASAEKDGQPNLDLSYLQGPLGLICLSLNPQSNCEYGF